MRRLYGITRDFVRQLAKDNISVYASGTAFFFFLSLMPTLIIVCSLLPLTSLTEKNLLVAAVKVMPDFLDSLTVVLIRQMYDQSVRILPFAIIIMLWSSSKGMLGLMYGLNVVNEVTETRNYFVLRLEATFYMVITVIAILVSLTLSVFGKSIIYALYTHLPDIGSLIIILMRCRFLFVWALLTIVFTVTYTYVPNKKMKMRYQIPGAVFSAVGWSAFSFIFSVYIEKFQGMSNYGSLSTIMIMMFWLYCCLYILLIGANLNRYFGPLIRLILRG